MKRALLVLVLFLFCIVSADTFSVQGVLRDPLGKTVEDGPYMLDFQLYNAEVGGSAIWEEIHESVLISNGVYLVELGSVTSLDAVPFNENYWIGISVNGGTEMEPRIKMTKSPAAMSVFGVDNVFPSSGQVGVGTHEPEAYLHIIDSTSGLDKLRVEGEDGANDVVVSAEGNMGVNVEDPQAGLHIQALDSDTDKLLITNTDGSTNMVVKADGKLGINTADPADALDITGDLMLRNNGKIKFTDGSYFDSANYGGPASSLLHEDNVTITADGNNDGVGSLEVISGNTTVMEVTPDENITVNTQNLQINNEEIMMESEEINISSDTNVSVDTPNMYLDASRTFILGRLAIGHSETYNPVGVDIRNQPVAIWNGSSPYPEYSTWSENGLFVQGNVEVGDDIFMGQGIIDFESAGTSDEGIRFRYTVNYSHYWRLNIFGSSPYDTYFGFYHNDQLVSYVNQTGDFITQFRDRSNGEPYNGVLDKVAEINPLKYNEVNEGNESREFIGFNNDEIQRLFPELVYDSTEENSIGVNTSGYGVVAISAVKELNEKVEEQEKKIEELEKALVELMQEVKNLKN